jgi:hypothetical protein
MEGWSDEMCRARRLSIPLSLHLSIFLSLHLFSLYVGKQTRLL